MRGLGYTLLNVFLTLLRVLPFPCRTGLVEIGSPGRDAPVLLTGNYRLTVERVKRALSRVDAHLLVANSRGINVWCAATGGLLTDHDVISALKTSGISDRVDHRTLVLPQLAATGIEARRIEAKTGWRVVWGPVDAASLPEFVARGHRKTTEMRTVSFPWLRRVEMAAAWAFPLSLLPLLAWPLWPGGVVPLIGVVWAGSMTLFLSFPLWERALRPSGGSVGFVFFDFGRWAAPLLLWGSILAAVVVYTMATGAAWTFVLRWGIGSFVVLVLLGIDLPGSTPTHKGGLHEDRDWRIAMDAERCDGAGRCEEVCPRDVLRIDADHRLATLPGVVRCVRCGACVVQCPADALYFRKPGGFEVAPEMVRSFKLNLIGKRRVAARR